MNLPEIPAGAVEVVKKALWSAFGRELTTAEIAAETLDSAWPHLYAAALRHAADRIEVEGGIGEMVRDTDVEMLREWADEATRP